MIYFLFNFNIFSVIPIKKNPDNIYEWEIDSFYYLNNTW